jgi:hypothetical protein
MGTLPAILEGRSLAHASVTARMPEHPRRAFSQVVIASAPSGVSAPQPLTASLRGGSAIGMDEAMKMLLDIANRAELEEVLLLNAQAEMFVGLDQNFIETQRVDAEILNQQRVGLDALGWGSRHPLQDVQELPL